MIKVFSLNTEIYIVIIPIITALVLKSIIGR